jgi:hypothetical protein
MAELEPMKNEETCYVAEDQDEGIDRAWWCAVSCPAYESCTKQGWKRAACWSYESEAQVQAYVLNHLMESSLHAMEEDMAKTMALDTEIEQLVETARERELATESSASSSLSHRPGHDQGLQGLARVARVRRGRASIRTKALAAA